MRPLYEINERITALVSPDGEITDVEALDSLLMERDDKLDGVLALYLNAKAEAELLRAEAQKLTERARKAERASESLREYLRAATSEQSFHKEGSVHSITWRKKVPTAEIDEALLPVDYYKVKTVEKLEPDKETIIRELQLGMTIPGCRLNEDKIAVIK